MINVNVDIHRDSVGDHLEWSGSNGDIIRELVFIVAAVAKGAYEGGGSLGLALFRHLFMDYMNDDNIWNMITEEGDEE